MSEFTWDNMEECFDSAEGSLLAYWSLKPKEEWDKGNKSTYLFNSFKPPVSQREQKLAKALEVIEELFESGEIDALVFTVWDGKIDVTGKLTYGAEVFCHKDLKSFEEALYAAGDEG